MTLHFLDSQASLMTGNFPAAEIKSDWLFEAFHRRKPVAKSYEALANYFSFLPSTQVSDLKVVVDRKDVPVITTVQQVEKGAKGDRGESGGRGLPGLDVSTTKGILEE